MSMARSNSERSSILDPSHGGCKGLQVGCAACDIQPSYSEPCPLAPSGRSLVRAWEVGKGLGPSDASGRFGIKKMWRRYSPEKHDRATPFALGHHFGSVTYRSGCRQAGESQRHLPPLPKFRWLALLLRHAPLCCREVEEPRTELGTQMGMSM